MVDDDEDVWMFLAMIGLLVVALVQEVLWIATANIVYLVAMLLGAAAASVVSRQLFNKPDPDLPAPPLYSAALNVYSFVSVLVMIIYITQSPLDLIHALSEALLAILIIAPLL
jgi:hypothetical protein